MTLPRQCALMVLLLLLGCAQPPRAPQGDLSGSRGSPLHTHRLRGIASWYGGKFHGRKTASGETYDMHALTAAHKTLPFGLRVKVRSLNTNKEVIVRINDRGPFVKNRVIDLSCAAAKRIGMLGTGTAPVRITPLAPFGQRAESDYSVQIGAFASYPNARRALDRLRQTRTDSRLKRVTLQGRTLWRVQTGDFSSLHEARQSLHGLRSRYPGAFIVAH